MKQEYQADEVDKRILRALQANASMTNSELAELAGASAASCWRRVRVMENAGVLCQAVRLVDPQAIGCGVNVLCQVRMKSHAEDKRLAFEKFIVERPEILECFSMSGEWDYQLRVVVRDVADYERFLMRVLLSHPSVANAASHFALGQVKYTTALPV